MCIPPDLEVSLLKLFSTRHISQVQGYMCNDVQLLYYLYQQKEKEQLKFLPRDWLNNVSKLYNKILLLKKFRKWMSISDNLHKDIYDILLSGKNSKLQNCLIQSVRYTKVYAYVRLYRHRNYLDSKKLFLKGQMEPIFLLHIYFFSLLF